jgi:hypothetical protein
MICGDAQQTVDEYNALRRNLASLRQSTRVSSSEDHLRPSMSDLIEDEGLALEGMTRDEMNSLLRRVGESLGKESDSRIDDVLEAGQRECRELLKKLEEHIQVCNQCKKC